MEYENTIYIDVKNLLALCNILDEFEEFNERAIKFFSGKDKKELLDKLIKVTKNEFCFNSRKVKKFYNENKKVIDTIKEHSYIWNFFSKGYCWNPKYTEELNYMYRYIKENREDLYKIIAVLEKIKEYKITNLQFNKDFDFTKETYKLNTYALYNSALIYLDNLEAIPGYDYSEVKYKTNGSNYEIDCQNKESVFRKAYDEIKLNSLVFDVNRLPESIDSKEIYEKILSLRDEKKDDYNAIRSSVRLNINLEDMASLTEKMNKVIERIDKTETKEELKKLLLIITETASKMKETTDNYDKENVKNSEYITVDVLEKEKQLEKNRISLSSLDID